MFRVGQKVVCIDSPTSDVRPPWREFPRKGAVYTVRGDRPHFEPSILLEEIISDVGWDGYEAGFAARRFRPIVERKTDIGFAHEILRKVSRKQGADA